MMTETAIDRSKLADAIVAFAKQRAQLDMADYGYHPDDRRPGSWNEARKALKGDYKLYSVPAAFNRRFLRENDLKMILSELSDNDIKRAFSGRLSITAESGLTYCTGQYYPTEFQGALMQSIRTLESAFKQLHRTMAVLGLRMSMSQIKALSQANGGHFFDADTMRFFGSRLQEQTFIAQNGWIFITSEKRGFTDLRREFKIRLCTADGDIRTVKTFATKEAAVKHAKSLAFTEVLKDIAE